VPGQSAFRVGQPAIDAFPHTIWQRLLSRRYRHSWQELFGYQDGFGYPPLREAIAAYLGMARGVRCTPDQVIITTGSQQGLDLLARFLLQPGDAVWMEDPGYDGARWAFQQAGLQVVPVPLDYAGLDVSAAQNLAPDARLVFVTPSHQFPLGMTMSLERRLALLAWAADHQSWIVEDDCNCEYRYAGRPLPALQGLDAGGRVLYLGTFSNILFPALRLGYLVVPPVLVDTLGTARRGADLHSPALEQAVVADFITQGHFVRHIRRMRTLYAHRQAILRTAIGRYLSGALEVYPDPAGMHLVAWLLPQVVETQPIVQSARAAGLELLPLSCFSMRPLSRQGLVLGYTAVDDDQIVEGVRILCRVIERTLMKCMKLTSIPG
jgi:GntR family transcriptional regulator/MocR family aminotransferase